MQARNAYKLVSAEKDKLEHSQRVGKFGHLHTIIYEGRDKLNYKMKISKKHLLPIQHKMCDR